MASKIQVDKISRNSGTPEFTIPTVDGTVGQFLKTDGSGVLSFDTVTTNPLTLTGSTNNTIPTITGANALTGEANFTYDGNTLDIKNAGTASSINLYCETSNLHYTKIKSGPHASATSYTITLPNTPPSVSGQALTATTAGVASWGAVGKVLQIVYTSLTTASSTSSSTYSGTNLPSVSITPTSTSNYLWILATLNVGTTNNAQGRFRIYDGSTQYAECKIGGNFQSQQTIGMQAIFQAPSTSSQTYSVQRKSDNALAVYVNEGSYNTVVPSVITIVEYSV